MRAGDGVRRRRGGVRRGALGRRLRLRLRLGCERLAGRADARAAPVGARQLRRQLVAALVLDVARVFRYDDGTRFPWIGDTNWINLYELAWGRTAAKPVTTALWRALCDRRAEYGFTLLQAVAWNGDERWLDGRRPFGGPDGTDHDLVDPLSWQRVDDRVQYAVKQGLTVNLLISSNGQHLAWPAAQREYQARGRGTRSFGRLQHLDTPHHPRRHGPALSRTRRAVGAAGQNRAPGHSVSHART